jgi:ABC-type nitrate/sulfonate/bicarbonate transport system substrate-binding protein
VTNKNRLGNAGASSGGISLERLKIAAAGPGSATNSKLNIALTKGGLTYKDSQNVNMSYPQQVAALTSKAIDASLRPNRWQRRPSMVA